MSGRGLERDPGRSVFSSLFRSGHNEIWSPAGTSSGTILATGEVFRYCAGLDGRPFESILSKKKSCCAPGGLAADCCRVESLVGVVERGQMVLPKELRDRADIKAGDKLAVVASLKISAVKPTA